MAERYSILPSKLLCEADTFDLMVMDVALGYRHWKEQSQSGGKPDMSMYNIDELQSKLRKARGEE